MKGQTIMDQFEKTRALQKCCGELEKLRRHVKSANSRGAIINCQDVIGKMLDCLCECSQPVCEITPEEMEKLCPPPEPAKTEQSASNQ